MYSVSLKPVQCSRRWKANALQGGAFFMNWVWIFYVCGHFICFGTPQFGKRGEKSTQINKMYFSIVYKVLLIFDNRFEEEKNFFNNLKFTRLNFFSNSYVFGEWAREPLVRKGKNISKRESWRGHCLLPTLICSNVTSIRPWVSFV